VYTWSYEGNTGAPKNGQPILPCHAAETIGGQPLESYRQILVFQGQSHMLLNHQLLLNPFMLANSFIHTQGTHRTPTYCEVWQHISTTWHHMPPQIE
jgi:hypothetical protein